MQTIDTDIIIVGGGLAGMAGALAFAQAGFEVAVIDGAPKQDRLAESYDGRASAIAYANFRMFEALGVAPGLEGCAQPIKRILVSDGRAEDGVRRAGPAQSHLLFDPTELAEPGEEGEPLGYIIENRRMRFALMQRADAEPGINHIASSAVERVVFHAGGARAELAGGAVCRAPLVIGADGARSLVRRAMNVRDVGWDYPQKGLVATVNCEHDHEGVAHEYFLPSGPFAILPMTEGRANLVWTEKSKAADAAMELDDAGFLDEIRRRFGDFLGALSLAGPRWSYPLGIRVAERFVAPRAALIGDAARRIHPIAGQGLNLGFKDVAALAETLQNARALGLDWGGLDTLERYQRWRRFDSVAMALACDGFNRLFSTDAAPVRALRDFGMSVVDKIAPARRVFMRAAGADLGALPKLLNGERLDAA